MSTLFFPLTLLMVVGVMILIHWLIDLWFRRSHASAHDRATAAYFARCPRVPIEGIPAGSEVVGHAAESAIARCTAGVSNCAAISYCTGHHLPNRCQWRYIAGPPLLPTEVGPNWYPFLAIMERGKWYWIYPAEAESSLPIANTRESSDNSKLGPQGSTAEADLAQQCADLDADGFPLWGIFAIAVGVALGFWFAFGK